MKFPIKTIKYLDTTPTAVSRSIEDAGSEGWEEDIATVSSDPGSGFPPDRQTVYIIQVSTNPNSN
jgi:hypothetical protein